MRLVKLLVLVVLFGASTLALAQRPAQMKILGKIQATIANAKKPKIETSFIANGMEWARVYRTFYPEGKIQPVDFSKHILLVSTQDARDPNRRRVTVLKDKKGVIQVQAISTLIGFQPSEQTKFTFYKVSRAGVTGVKRYDRKLRKLVVDPLPKSKTP